MYSEIGAGIYIDNNVKHNMLSLLTARSSSAGPECREATNPLRAASMPFEHLLMILEQESVGEEGQAPLGKPRPLYPTCTSWLLQ
jgi:hypothetical protein